MRQVRRWSFPLVLALLVGVAACGGDSLDEAQDEVDRELELAMAGDSAAAIDDAALEAEAAEEPAPEPAPAPRRAPPPAPRPEPQPEPEPEPAGPTYEELVVASGTAISSTLDQELSTKNNQVGDVFTATVTTAVTDGRNVLIPAGAKIRGEITAVQASGSSGEEAVLKVAFDEISFDGMTYPLDASITRVEPTTEGRSSTGEKAAKIGGGAVVGGILGRVIGGNKTGTIIGAVVGGAAGTAIAMGNEDVDAVLAQGSPMDIETNGVLIIRREL
ncbi:MAG: hypothetical protein ABFS14_03720 [Gemmatimonadota bacterium]